MSKNEKLESIYIYNKARKNAVSYRISPLTATLQIFYKTYGSIVIDYKDEQVRSFYPKTLDFDDLYIRLQCALISYV